MTDATKAGAAAKAGAAKTDDHGPISFPPPAQSWPGEPVPGVRTLVGDQAVARVALPDGSMAWLITGFEEARQAAIDPRFSRALAVAPGRSPQGIDVLTAGSILGLDPPEHTRLRKLVGSAFTARRVEAMRPRVAGIVTELIDALLSRPQPADLVSGFALPLPVTVICEMLGVPTQDMEQFHVWSDTAVGDWQRDGDVILAALAEMYQYFGQLAALKRAEPADDLMTALIAARDQDDRLSEEELTALGCALLVGGHETTANMIVVSLIELLAHPADLAKLRADPGLIPGAVEELVRYVPLGGGLPLTRVATQDVRLGDVVIAAGEVVLPHYGGANRDPAVFDDPDRLDVCRAPASHLGFGAGTHHCLGAQLARLELQEAFRGLLGRLPRLRLAVAAKELRFRQGMALHSLCELPVRWDDH
jgi:cytochrome P450